MLNISGQNKPYMSIKSDDSEMGLITNPLACPVCLSDDFKSKTHSFKCNGDLEFSWKCNDCNNEFSTIMESESNKPSNYTLFVTYDLENNLNGVFVVEGSENSTQVKQLRAKFNFKDFQCVEVHGKKESLERLFNDLVEENELYRRVEQDIMYAIPNEN